LGEVLVKGVPFEEDFVADLIAEHMTGSSTASVPTITDAFDIYMRESLADQRRKFAEDATRYFNYFRDQFGDLKLHHLKHWHGIQYRDAQLKRGLSPVSVRKHFNMLNAMLNLAFRYLDIDRLSPFRAIKIPNEGKVVREMVLITPELLQQALQKLLWCESPHRLLALMQVNTGLRISEPTFARLEDCVLDHHIPHIWVRGNRLTSRKNKSSIRVVPLYGVSLEAARKLHERATQLRSEWLAPDYAKYNGANFCSAAINKSLSSLKFRSHMFRHAIIDRMKACNDIPVRLRTRA
jgi:integrase